ncbi:hypothetical protein [Deinococcus roseus]|uniref:OmpR/PhoB-type domain-containing protein n=1 Tax=Deinococcus roseus TaxID=392414 RepID=A0ABQ2CZY1_9DEIO|nr:hypothetical protein [Deinococcus roseus]GGJ37359.1 hypothetical protein GCM10008938_24340 [Deinococcus roseus]
MNLQTQHPENWYQTHSLHFRQHPSFEFVGSPEHGIQHLIYHQLSNLPDPVWFEVTSQIAHDPVLTSNALVDAFNKASGERVLDHGMHYPYVLTVIKRYTPLFGKHTFIFSGTQHAPEFAKALLELQQEGHHVILIGKERLSDLPLLTSEDLRLTRPEAALMAEPFRLTETQIREAYDSTKGTFERYWIRLHELIQRPAPLRPTPEGFKYPPGFEVDLEPRLLASLLYKKAKYLDALEVAVMGYQAMVLDVIEQAGTKALLTGAHERLHVLLESLPRHLKEDEVVMRWRIEAACLLGKKEDIRKEVLAYLEEHEAPDVRAVAVLNLIIERDIAKEVEKCFQSRRSIYTLKAKTFLLSYLKKSVYEDSDIPFEALSMAENQENLLEIIRCSRLIAMYCGSTYRFKEAMHWTQFSLSCIEKIENFNTIDHIYTINLWIHFRILENKTEGLSIIIEQGIKIIKDVSEIDRQIFENTIANFRFITGDFENAINFWKDVWEKSDRVYKAFYSYEYIKCLACMGEFSKAREIAEESYTYSKGLHEAYRVHSMISRAYLLAIDDSKECLELLNNIDLILKENFHTSVFICSLLLKIICLKNLKNIDLLNKTLEDNKSLLSRISDDSIKYYLGYKRLIDIYFSQQRNISEFNFLGDLDITINSKKVKIPLRQAEVLLFLALNKEGVKGEKLMMDVYGEDNSDSYGSLKTTISKMRKSFSIDSNPYKISEDYNCDVFNLLELIKIGKMQDVIESYKGALLPQSQCVSIENLRRFIDEYVKKSAILTQNMDYMLKVYDKMPDDLELLENIIEMMNNGDPRKIVLQMKFETLII